MMTRHMFIIGMPGSGKSSLGRRAAADLNLRYLDTDKLIEDAAGCTIPQIFERWGEQPFRNAETNLLIRLSAEEPAIISTGGGMVMREENRRILRNHGYIVLIDRPLEDIKSDIKLDRRPLLAKKGLAGVEELYHDRIDIYRAAADAVLDNGHGYQNGLNGLKRIINDFFPPRRG